MVALVVWPWDDENLGFVFGYHSTQSGLPPWYHRFNSQFWSSVIFSYCDIYNFWFTPKGILQPRMEKHSEEVRPTLDCPSLAEGHIATWMVDSVNENCICTACDKAEVTVGGGRMRSTRLWSWISFRYTHRVHQEIVEALVHQENQDIS